jgi:zinc protease
LPSQHARRFLKRRSASHQLAASSHPTAAAFKPQQPKRIELKNGMVIFLQEDHELPLIDGTARIRGGSVNEPASKTGLIDIYSEVWRTGGTKSQTGDQLDDFLEVRAAKVETGGAVPTPPPSASPA